MAESSVDELTLLSWQCTIPIECSTESATSFVRRVNFIVPKQGYIYHHIKTAIPQLFDSNPNPEDYFHLSTEIPYLDSKGKKQTFSFNVPMQYPVCVIFDMIAAISPENHEILGGRALTIKMHTTPELLPEAALQMQFKELDGPVAKSQGDLEIAQRQKMASMIRFGTIKPRLEGIIREITQLFEAIRNNDCRSHMQVYESWKAVGRTYLADAEEITKLVAPFMFHIRTPSSEDPKKSVIKSMIVKVPYKRFHTLGYVLREYIPCCFDLTDNQCTSNEPCKDNARVFVMGAQPALGTPAEWLMENIVCADWFVHVTVVPLKSNAFQQRPARTVAKSGDGEEDDANIEFDETVVLSDGSMTSPGPARRLSGRSPRTSTVYPPSDGSGSPREVASPPQPKNTAPASPEAPVAAPEQESSQEVAAAPVVEDSLVVEAPPPDALKRVISNDI